MTAFSTTDAAFTGFRIVRQRPKVVATWAAVNLVLSLLLFAVGGPVWRQIADLAPDADQNQAKMVLLLQQAWPFLAGFFIVGIALNAVICAAMNRAVLRPQDDRFGYLRLGIDELRQLGLILLLLALFVVVYAAILGAAIGLSIIGGLAAQGSPEVIRSVMFMAVFAGAAAAGVFLGCRLSVASAMTFDTGRIDLRAAWALTQGRFGTLFATYVLTFALTLCVSVLSAVVATAAAAAVQGGVGGLDQIADIDTSSWAAFLDPAKLVHLVLTSISQALVWPLWIAPSAAIYRMLKTQTLKV